MRREAAGPSRHSETGQDPLSRSTYALRSERLNPQNPPQRDTDDDGIEHEHRFDNWPEYPEPDAAGDSYDYEGTFSRPLVPKLFALDHPESRTGPFGQLWLGSSRACSRYIHPDINHFLVCPCSMIAGLNGHCHSIVVKIELLHLKCLAMSQRLSCTTNGQ
jgi:hypothetical protein